MFIAMVMTFVAAEAVAAPHKEKKQIETTEFSVDIDCEKCVKKIMDFMPHQKGIEDVKVDLKREIATVKYDKAKSSDAAIIKLFSKIHIKAKKYVPAPPKKDLTPSKDHR